MEKEGTGKKIPVVDDKEDSRVLVGKVLVRRGYEVIGAGTGEETIKMAQTELPDPVILDIMMPKMDGFEICRCLRKWSQTPIIMLSARGGEVDKVKCLDLDADDYITKPFGANEQDDHISNVIDHRDVNEIAISVYTKDPDWESYFNRIENRIAWTHHLRNCEVRFLDAESKGCWTY